jgi:hypothetical protein
VCGEEPGKQKPRNCRTQEFSLLFPRYGAIALLAAVRGWDDVVGQGMENPHHFGSGPEQRRYRRSEC